jgi:AraC-like DNA-binding protein
MDFMTNCAVQGGAYMPEMYEQSRDDMVETMCFRSRNNSCMPHFHSSTEIVYVADGVLSAILDGQRYDVPRGSVLITSGYTVHRYFTETSSEVIVWIIPISFVPILEKPLANKRFAKAVYADEGGELSTLIPLMYSRWNVMGTEARRGFSQLLLGILMDRVSLNDMPIKAPAGLMRNMLAYLQENSASSLSMEKLARHLGYSRSRLSHLFRDNFGCSFSDYVNSLRCRRAARLLAQSDLTQLEISLMTGFECIRTFYRAFYKCYGMTPKQYVHSVSQPGNTPAAHP